MNELRDLLPVPAERDLPAGRLEQRKAALLTVVEADLRRPSRLLRLRVLRGWLLALAVIAAAAAAAAGTCLTTELGPKQAQAVVGVAVAVSAGPVVASVARVPSRSPALMRPAPG